MYSAISSIPSGGPPGGTHTQELWYSLRGIDVGLQSVLSADKCPCGACCVRVSRYYFAPEYSTLYHQSLIFRRRCKFFGEKTHVAKIFKNIRFLAQKWSNNNTTDDDDDDGGASTSKIESLMRTTTTTTAALFVETCCENNGRIIEIWCARSRTRKRFRKSSLESS